jgi:hypothetical protein
MKKFLSQILRPTNNESLKILITNVAIQHPTGSEINVRDWSLAMLELGHRPYVYSPLVGELAEALRKRTIPVTDDLSQLQVTPDVALVCDSMSLLVTICRYPEIPIVYVVQNWDHWATALSYLPQIQRIMAVDEVNTDRALIDGALPAKITLINNAVDLKRFPERPRMKEASTTMARRALIFAKNSGHVETVVSACREEGLEVDVRGLGNEQFVAPEEVLYNYDVIFATARGAIEAMASGAAVIVCDGRGLAGLVTLERYQAWKPHNFGVRILKRDTTLDAVRTELKQFDAAQAEQVSELMRQELGLDHQIHLILDLLRQAIADRADAPPDALKARLALVKALQATLPRVNTYSPAFAST